MANGFTGNNVLTGTALQRIGRAGVGLIGFQAGFNLAAAVTPGDSLDLGAGLVGGLVGANVAVGAFDGITNRRSVRRRLFF